MKKKILAVGAVVLCLFGLQIDAEAGVNKEVRKAGKPSNFSDEWENTIYYCTNWEDPSLSNSVARMVYGYETDFWDEDYVWTEGYTRKTQAALTNSKGTYGAGAANAWKFSKEEVHHKNHSTDVIYKIWMEKENGGCPHYYYDTHVK